MALAPKYILLTSGTSWTVPTDWNSGANQIHLIGGGGGGTTGVGGGGGGYTLINNFVATPGSSITYAIGLGGTGGGNGGNTTFNSGAYSAGGGVGGNTTGAGGTGSTFNGGNGGLGTGGGGAGGPNGNGVNGTAAGGAGGAGDAGFGGAGGSGSGAVGGNGLEIWPGVAGSGGGSSGSAGGTGGLYGGGAGKGSSSGAQGTIIIVYIASSSGYTKNDPILGRIDLDDEYVTDQWLVDQFVGNNLFSCGYNLYGQLADTTGGTASYKSSPVQVGSLSSWKQVSTGGYHGLAVKTDGTLWGWGYNAFGQVGSGNLTNYSSPVQIGALTNWKQVATTYFTSHAIKTDGSLWAWGQNADGEAGHGVATTTIYSSPVQVGSITNWKQISTGTGKSFQVAIRNDGTMWAWGNNIYGQLGIGIALTGYSSPIQIGLLNNWKQVSCGYTHAAAIRNDGTLWAWGGDSYGSLGQGNNSFTNRSSPVQVGQSTNWAQVAAGSSATIAIKTDGTLWAIGGDNARGQLGLNSSSNAYSSPVQVGSLTNWKQVSMGRYSTVAVKTDGSLWTWGENTKGQLAQSLSAATNRSSPVQVGINYNWKQVGNGHLWTAAVTFKEIG